MINKNKGLVSIYIVGVICVVVLLIRIIIGGNNVINKDAMIPFTYFESSSILLAIGSIPMSAISYLLYKELSNKRKFLVFIPAIISVCSLLYWIVAVILELIK